MSIEKKDFESKEYRQVFAEQFVKELLPFQIEILMKHRGMSKQDLAKATGLSEQTIARAINPNSQSISLNTVIKIAAAFDVAFVAKFIPFSKLHEMVTNLKEDDWKLPSFNEELW